MLHLIEKQVFQFGVVNLTHSIAECRRGRPALLGGNEEEVCVSVHELSLWAGGFIK